MVRAGPLKLVPLIPVLLVALRNGVVGTGVHICCDAMAERTNHAGSGGHPVVATD